MPVFTPQLQNNTAVWPVFISGPLSQVKTLVSLGDLDKLPMSLCQPNTATMISDPNIVSDQTKVE